MIYLHYSLLFIISYLLGSIPSAYLLIKYFHGKDITKEGSGNAGAMNSYDVSKSKYTGIVVFIIDFLKGLIPAIIFVFYLKIDPAVLVPLFFAVVLGHNFSIWLKFKGGRGLATSAGIAVIINFWILIIWIALFLIANLIKKNVHIDNVFATILMPIIVIFGREFILPYSNGINTFGLLFSLCSVISIAILLKHIEPIIDIIKGKNNILNK